MSLSSAGLTGSHAEARASAVSGSRHRLRWWHILALAAMALVISAGMIVAVLAATYQPLSFGASVGITNLSYGGLPYDPGIRPLLPFDAARQEYYVPPRRGTFWLFTAIVNNGTRAVVIESVTLPRGGPLWSAGTSRYSKPPNGGNGANAIPDPVHDLRNVRLGPGQGIFVVIPVRTLPCGQMYRWAEVRSFEVNYRFGPFTNTAAVGWGTDGGPLTMHWPGGKAGQKGVICESLIATETIDGP